MHVFTGKGNPNNIYRIKQRKLEKKTTIKVSKLKVALIEDFKQKPCLTPERGALFPVYLIGPEGKNAGIPSHLVGFCVEPYLLATSSTR